MEKNIEKLHFLIVKNAILRAQWTNREAIVKAIILGLPPRHQMHMALELNVFMTVTQIFLNSVVTVGDYSLTGLD